jgi:hypothetical protein
MTKQEAVQYRERWRLAKLARVQELQRKTIVEKVRDLEMLFEFGEALGWPSRADDTQWEDWRRLKEILDV